MAYRYGKHRGQMMVLPPTLDQYVSQENPVRAYDAFVDALDFKKIWESTSMIARWATVSMIPEPC